jgi:hypothetical protein
MCENGNQAQARIGLMNSVLVGGKDSHVTEQRGATAQACVAVPAGRIRHSVPAKVEFPRRGPERAAGMVKAAVRGSPGVSLVQDKRESGYPSRRWLGKEEA